MYKLTNNGVQRLADGASIPFANGNRDYEEYKQWLAEGNIPEPEFTAAELLAKTTAEDISNAKKNGGVYTLNTINYQVPFDVDAQNTVVAITVQNIVGLFVSTTMEFSNGVKMPITAADWMAFATWFGTERNKFFV